LLEEYLASSNITLQNTRAFVFSTLGLLTKLKTRLL
jgi:hypothetical protein